MTFMIETERVYLREWQEKDVSALVGMNQDSQVMRYFPKALTEEETRVMLERIKAGFIKDGMGWYACVLKDTDVCIGLVGLSQVGFEASFTPAVEIGWRLNSKYHGKGYAAEAARAVMQFGFEKLGLKEIVSFTVPENQASRCVMEKLGMVHYFEEDFAHPKLPADHWLSKHVLYRITKDQWQNIVNPRVA